MIRFQGYVFRSITPRYAYQPLSMAGAASEGGRYNAKGSLVLYTSLDPVTSVAEIQNGLAHFSPKTIVCYYADIDNIVDLSTKADCVAAGIDPHDLSCEWRFLDLIGSAVPSRQVADDLRSQGAYGMKVPSFAKLRPKGAVNLVIWDFGGIRPKMIAPYDLKNDLPKNENSWI